MMSSINAGEGARRTKERGRRKLRRVVAFAALGAVLAVVSRLIWPGHTRLFTETIDPTYAVWAALTLCVVMPVMVILAYRTADEHELRSALWGTFFGFHALVIGGLAWLVLAVANLVPLLSLVGLIAASMVLTVAAGLWAQYR